MRNAPWLWFCEDCGVIGVLLSDDGVVYAQKELAVVHGASSENCRGRGLKLLSFEEMNSARTLGKIRPRPYPLIVSYTTTDEYVEYAKVLARSIRLHRLDYEIDQISPEELHVEDVPLEKVPHGEDPKKLRFWKASVLYKPTFIRKKLEAHPDRDIVWIDADAKLMDFPKFLMERPDFDISFYHMDILGNEPFGGTVFYRNRVAVYSLVKEWEAEVKRNPKALDEHSLSKVVNERKDIIFKILPPEYCWVERWMRQKHRAAVPIIEQHAVSRPLEIVVRRPI